jgi:putative ABC transport system permease protein
MAVSAIDDRADNGSPGDAAAWRSSRAPVPGNQSDTVSRSSVGTHSGCTEPSASGGIRAYAVPAAPTRQLRPVVRVRSRNVRTLESLRQDVVRLKPAAPLSARWWSDSIDQLMHYRNPRFQSLVLGGFAVLAFLLTGVGVFSMVAFTVVRRRQKIGVRLSLGASRGASRLYEVDVSDSRTLLFAAAVVAVARLLASYLSATRAARLNPVDVLRAE